MNTITDNRTPYSPLAKQSLSPPNPNQVDASSAINFWNQWAQNGFKNTKDAADVMSLFQTQNGINRGNTLFNQWQTDNAQMQPLQNAMMGWLGGNNLPSWMRTPERSNMPTAPTSLLDSTMSTLQGAPNPDDIYKQVTGAYNTLGTRNLNDTYQNRVNSITRDFGGRGLMMPTTGMTSAAVGLGNWRDNASAKLGAEGQLAGIDAAGRARAERVSNSQLLESLLASLRGEQYANGQYQDQFGASTRNEAMTNFYNLLNSILGQNNATLNASNGLATPALGGVAQPQPSQGNNALLGLAGTIGGMIGGGQLFPNLFK